MENYKVWIYRTGVECIGEMHDVIANMSGMIATHMIGRPEEEVEEWREQEARIEEIDRILEEIRPWWESRLLQSIGGKGGNNDE